MPEAPRIERVLETALHVADVERTTRFYQEVMGFEPMVRAEGFAALDAGGATVLLVFERGSAAEGSQTAGGWVPSHDAHGRSHIAFAVSGEAELERWVERLAEAGVAIESRVTWPRGGTSIYVRDPDGHSVELATPGLWPVY